MAVKYLQIYNDGCNGYGRGELLNQVPAGYEEQNDGGGIWEGPDGQGEDFYVEIRDNESSRDATEDDAYEDEDEDEDES